MTTADAAGLVRSLQERAGRAFPAVILERRHGWWLRYAGSGAWWASSVLPHTDALPQDPSGELRFVEKFYASYGTGARFQVSPGACPVDLDDALARRGYRVDSPMSLQTAETAHVIDRSSVLAPLIRIDDQPTDPWFEPWWAVHGTGADPAPERAMLRRVDRPTAYVSVRGAKGVVGVGRAVAETGWAGVFGMATLPEARGVGVAGQVLVALARWAADHGAGRMYLQVECDNTAARRLYARAGFTEICRYHYRTQASIPRA